MKNTQNTQLIDSIKEFLNQRYHFKDEVIKQIIDKITECTNENLNFEYYPYSPDDYVSDSIISDFIFDEVKQYHKDGFDSLDEAKATFNDYIYDKYFFDYSYSEYLVDDLNKIKINQNDWTIEYLDWWDVFYNIRDEFWILDLEVDWIGLCKSEYRMVIFSKKDESDFAITFDSWKYNEYKKDIKELKKDSLMNLLCKKHGFDIEDIYKFELSKEWSKMEAKYKEKRKNNKFFDELYSEFVNTFWYCEDIAILVKLWIEDILNFFVKWSTFNLKNTWSIGLYDNCNWSGSLFEVHCYNDCIVNCDKLILNLYKNTSIESCYGFCDSVFNWF